MNAGRSSRRCSSRIIPMWTQWTSFVVNGSSHDDFMPEWLVPLEQNVVPASVGSMLPAPKGRFPAPVKVQTWLADTGTALHLVAEGDLAAQELARIHPCSAVRLHTPNGIVTSSRCIDMFIPALKANISPSIN